MREEALPVAGQPYFSGLRRCKYLDALAYALP